MRKIMVLALSAILTFGLWCTASLAGEPATSQLKLNEAINMATKNNNSIKKSDLSIDKAQEERDNASDKLTFRPSTGNHDPATDASFYGLLTADLSWEMSKRSYSAEEDRLALDVCLKYWNVQKSLEAVKSKELAVSKAEFAQRRVQAMVRVGMTPPDYSGASPEAALAGAGAALEKAKSDLVSAKNKLNSDYEALNQLLGLMPQDRRVLVDEPKFEKLQDVNLEASVQKVLESSPSIWQAEEKVNLAKYAYELMFATGSYKSYEVRKIENEQAELDALSAKDAVSLVTRSLYYSVRNLEAGRPAAEKLVSGAEESLRVAKLSYELGMITLENLKEREAALAEAKKSLLELTIQHAYAKLAFQKPWAASASSS